ncbi:hypothetical protein [Nocardioides jensenii]|uniref:hypothetical protein n=1 Tax=Nocardioides jensenii TaxID=1843 RepID=UPI00082F6EEA|nr:hypothetical protein [Nocardioides jensenii]
MPEFGHARALDAAENGEMKVILVCSSPLHLSQLMCLRPWWEQQETTWVTLRTDDAVARLDGERVVWAARPSSGLPLLAHDLRLAWRVLYDVRPDVVIRTEDGTTSPFSWISRLFGARYVELEVFDPTRQSTRIPCTTTRFTNLGDARAGQPTPC